MTYRQIDNRGDDESPKSTEISIGDVGAQHRGHPHGTHPIGDIVGCCHSALMKLICQIQYEIGRYPIKCHPFEHFIHCIVQNYKLRHHYFQFITIQLFFLIVLNRKYFTRRVKNLIFFNFEKSASTLLKNTRVCPSSVTIFVM